MSSHWVRVTNKKLGDTPIYINLDRAIAMSPDGTGTSIVLSYTPPHSIKVTESIDQILKTGKSDA